MYRRKSSKCDQKWNIHLCSQTVGQSRNSKTHPKHNTRMIPFLIVDDCRHWSPPQAFSLDFCAWHDSTLYRGSHPISSTFSFHIFKFYFPSLESCKHKHFFLFFFRKISIFVFTDQSEGIFSYKETIFFIWQKNKIFSTLWARWHHAHAVAILLVRILFCLWKSRRPMIRTAINGWKERNVIVLGYVNPTKEKKLLWYKDLDYQLFQ